MINKGQRYKVIGVLVVALFLIGLIYCGVLAGRSQQSGSPENVVSASKSPDLTRAFVGVVKALDLEEKTISILGTENAVVMNFRYNGGTDIRNQYDSVISMKAISMGEIVYFQYNSKTNKLLSLQIYEDAWTYENVRKMKMDQGNKVIALGTSSYGFTDSILYVGDNEIISVSDLSSKDQLTVKGIGDTIYSIIVTKGHGTIHFTNYEEYIGGTVYIGSSVYQHVTETMDIVMREGTYKVTMQKGAMVAETEVTVERGREVTVDMSKAETEKAEAGEVTFVISPYGADLYIDGNATDYSDSVELAYGDHTIYVVLNGYKSFSGTLTVGQSEQDIEVNLVPDTSEEESSSEEVTEDSDTTDDDDIILDWDSDTVSDAESSASPSASPSASATSTPAATSASIDTLHKVTISSPEDVEVYVDDAYKGITPVSFTKMLGTHTITLKKDGYTTKTYTVNIQDDNENVFYTFSELVKE